MNDTPITDSLGLDLEWMFYEFDHGDHYPRGAGTVVLEKLEDEVFRARMVTMRRGVITGTGTDVAHATSNLRRKLETGDATRRGGS